MGTPFFTGLSPMSMTAVLLYQYTMAIAGKAAFFRFRTRLADDSAAARMNRKGPSHVAAPVA
jgi:hypothetical protein